MRDSSDDTAADGAPSDAGETSTQPSGDPDVEASDAPRADGPASVAAAAGVDDADLDVPRELASLVRLRWFIRSTIGAGVVGAVAAGITYVAGTETAYLPGDTQTAAAVGGTVFALSVLYGAARAVLLYRSWTYVVRADSLYLSRGVFTRVRTIVPYVRVQHIDTTRSPLERLLGLATLVVYTAGSRGADVRIPGLTPDRASTLQRRLERLAIESEEADAV